MDNGIVGNAAMPRPMPVPARPAVADSLAQDRNQPQSASTRPNPDNPATTPAEPDPVPQAVSSQATSGETRDRFINELRGMAEQMANLAQAQGRALEFVVNGENDNDVVILVRDGQSGEVVRTIPPDELTELSRSARTGDLNLVSVRA